jgi:hypothetical protein
MATGIATHTLIDMDSMIWVIGRTSTKIANSADSIQGGDDIFIARYRPDGFPVFIRMVGTIENDVPAGVIIQEDFAVGSVDVVVAFNTADAKSMTIVRINSEGHLVFHETYANSFAHSLEYVIGRIIVVASDATNDVTQRSLTVYSIDFYTGIQISKSCVKQSIKSNANIATTRRFYDIYLLVETSQGYVDIIANLLATSNVCDGTSVNEPVGRPTPKRPVPSLSPDGKAKAAKVWPWVLAIVLLLLAVGIYALVQYIQTKDKFRKLEELEHGHLEDDIEGLRQNNELADRMR